MQLHHISNIELKDRFGLLWTTRGLSKNKIIPTALLLLGFLSLTFSSFGQAIGDYRSAATGEWRDINTWERWSGAAWVTPTPIFPVVAGTESSSKDVTTGTTHTISLPSGIVSNDLLLIFWSDANTSSTAPTTPTGWTQLYSNTSGNGNRNRTTWYKVADGSEGTTLDITAGAERSAHNAYRISAGTYFDSPVAGAPVSANSTTQDPPSLTPGFLFNNNTLWIAATHSRGDDNTPAPTAPTNYSDLISGYTGLGNGHARMLTARRELSAASEDPDAFTVGSTDVQHAANTIAIQGVVIPVGQGVPTSTSGAITIRSGHTVTVATSASADECIIGAGSQITVNSGQTLTIEDGTGTDLTVNGTLSNSGTITNNGSIAFSSDGIYIHDQNGGTVPTATWDASSTCQVTGVVNTSPLNTTQNFGHFTWNCPNQTGNRRFEGNSAFVIQGNLNIFNTGTGELRFRANKANIVGGNLTQSGGILVNRNNGTHSLTVNGNFELSGGTFRNDGDDTPGGVLNVAGNFLQSGGTFNGGSLLNVFFTGSTQTFTKALIATLSGTVNFTINSGANVNIGTSQMPCEDFTLIAGGTLQTTVNSLATFGQVSFAGSATTDGTITANFGSFVPMATNTFDLISGGTPSGTPTITTTSDTHVLTTSYINGTLTIDALVLPVELISFEGKAIDQSVALTWLTATEVNNEKFIIERSGDGKTYKSIGEVQGKGTTLEQQEYSFLDKSPYPGINYYRLKQIDYDGMFEYTNVISVLIKRGNGSISLFPNPATETATLSLASDYIGEAKLTVYDRVGRQIIVQSIRLEGGTFQTNIDLSQLSAGLYIIQINAGGKKWQEKLMVN